MCVRVRVPFTLRFVAQGSGRKHCYTKSNELSALTYTQSSSSHHMASIIYIIFVAQLSSELCMFSFLYLYLHCWNGNLPRSFAISCKLICTGVRF